MITEYEAPPNWVAERAKCNLDLTFEALFQVVKRDVDEINKIHPGDFELEQNSEGTKPMIQVKKSDNRKVTFTKSEVAIRINTPEKIILAHPKWNSETTSCKLIVDNQPLKIWQISQLALGDLFFNPA